MFNYSNLSSHGRIGIEFQWFERRNSAISRLLPRFSLQVLTRPEAGCGLSAAIGRKLSAAVYCRASLVPGEKLAAGF